jgi:ribose/xylose/arabinose/galactoside ABC-type transport system permease subunit
VTRASGDLVPGLVGNALSPAVVLKVVEATKRFGNFLALDDASLSVAEGAACALLGAKGSGKSTLIKTLAGCHELDAGVVELHGATSIRPGHYNVWGTVIAVYLVGLGTTGIFMLGASSYTEPVFDGAVLLIAIGLAKLSARGLRKS